MTKADLVERVRALAPDIAARAAVSERQRSPHDDTIRDLIDAEIFQTLVPKRWGGHELGLDAQLEIVELIAAADVSAAWIAAFYIGHNWTALRFCEQAQAEIFADRPFCLLPATSSGGIKGKRVAGGWEVSGRANWGSGIMHADWAALTGEGDGGRRIFLMPVGDARIEDVWQMAGMAGTGSNDVVVESVFVPDHRSLSHEQFAALSAPGTAIHANPLYRLPTMLFAYCQVAGVFSGGLTGAAGAFADIVRKRVTTFGQVVARDSSHMHIQLGEALTEAAIARRLALDLVSRTTALIDRPVTLDARLAHKGQAGYLTDLCRRGVNTMINRSGSSSFRLDMPLQRFFRDLNTIAPHAFWNWETACEQVGRHDLDLAPNNPLV